MGRIWVALLCVLVATSSWGDDPIRVVTTLPDLADWARQIGGDRVEARSLLKGFENPHTYEPKVSDVKTLARSRVLVKVGLGLEEWIDGLVENARNSELLIIDASRGVQVSREQGGHDDDHAHLLGNPHVWLDPANAAVMCRNIARGLETADPFANGYYQKRLTEYLKRIQEAAGRIRAAAADLPDRRFLSYHPAWPYFARGLGFEFAGVVTEIPGQEPSARAMAALIQRIRSEGIRVLVTEPQLSSKLPEILSAETGIRVITLSPLLSANQPGGYLDLLASNAETLIAALRESRP